MLFCMAKAFPRRKRKLLVQFVDAQGEKQTGFTRDVSLTGFFVLAPTLPSVGPLSVALHLPSGKVAQLQGNVVRHAAPGQSFRGNESGFGFGLTGYSEDYHRFVETLG